MARAFSRRTAPPATVVADDGVALAVRVVGRGPALAFVHEFTGDLRSWAPQFAAFAPSYRCIAFNARGYPPSDTPASASAYSQARAADDVAVVIAALARRPAHVVGLSMGGFAALHCALRHPQRVRSLVLAGVGYGAKPEQTASHARASRREADHALTIGIGRYARMMAASDYAAPLRTKNPRAWRRFAHELSGHSVEGMAATLRYVLAGRPSLWRLAPKLKRLRVPTLIVVGDRDEPCLEPALFLRRTIPGAELAVLPGVGHLTNLEEASRFNALVAAFIAVHS